MFSLLRSNVRSIMSVRRVSLTLAFLVASATGQAETFRGIDVQREGKGPAMIFIPGLNSSRATFADTCAQFKAQYTCILLTLPGFAGQPPLKQVDAGFLVPMRDAILAYIAEQKIKQPVLVGHSLGGALALMIAEKAPTVPKALVIVDSLPFFSAIQNPQATSASATPMAENMKKQMLEQPLEQYQKTAARMAVMGMSNQAVRQATLLEWSQKSDRATTTQAMFELMTTDLRERVGTIKTPTLVLGAWAAYKSFGSTAESTKAIYLGQYQKLKGVKIEMSDSAYHFISWDDPKWLGAQVKSFLKTLPKA